MATSPSPMTPPPGAGQDTAPTSPQAASPSPPQPSPEVNAGNQSAILIVAKAREIAKAYPETAPLMAQINDLVRQAMPLMMKSQQPGEPQAPPIG